MRALVTDSRPDRVKAAEQLPSGIDEVDDSVGAAHDLVQSVIMRADVATTTRFAHGSSSGGRVDAAQLVSELGETGEEAATGGAGDGDRCSVIVRRGSAPGPVVAAVRPPRSASGGPTGATPGVVPTRRSTADRRRRRAPPR